MGDLTWRPPSRLTYALTATSVAVVAVVWAVFLQWGGKPSDARCIYDIDWQRLYVLDEYPYAYTPAFAQLTAPLRLLDFEAFTAVVRAGELAALVILAPFAAWLAVWLPPVATEINAANINLMLMLCVVASLRWPATWLLPLLTKPSMGVGLLWYVARGEWRKLGIAVGVAGVVALVSLLATPRLWIEYVAFLTTLSDTPDWPFPIPVWPRLPIAIALVWWGAKTDRQWALPAAAIIAMPRLYFLSISMLIGILPTLRRGSVLAWVRSALRSVHLDAAVGRVRG